MPNNAPRDKDSYVKKKKEKKKSVEEAIFNHAHNRLAKKSCFGGDR